MVGAGGCCSVDLLFFAANLTKLVHGAWLPLLDRASSRSPILTTWQRGRALVTRQREHDEGSLRAFVDDAARAGSPRCGACRAPPCSSTAASTTAPLAMRANVEHNHILHEHVVILSIETLPVPHVPPARAARASTTSATPTTASPTSRARFGYMDDPERPGVAAS